LEGLHISITINSGKNIITCMTLFEQYRDCADLGAKEKYKGGELKAKSTKGVPDSREHLFFVSLVVTWGLV
ncbi:hypothetical protein, partial [Mycobacteroides abscessus]|uniref:hypothetical protein n=1 Tax=Mycobacteroides abscessus TaxID=36809 RepID=UPI001A982240